MWQSFKGSCQAYIDVGYYHGYRVRFEVKIQETHDRRLASKWLVVGFSFGHAMRKLH